ncbi:MAG TPA: hypothetical protein VGO91_15460 [Pyrinomonadaceae bacterium]|jgi:hypothetical protein|nr:hypothetical protein [Pyrinomonadaceae bacterium]
MKKGISEQEFRLLCDDVERDATAILRDRRDVPVETALQRELFERLCDMLEIDTASVQATDLLDTENGYSFAIMQTIEEKMRPEFLYIEILGPFLRRASVNP